MSDEPMSREEVVRIKSESIASLKRQMVMLLIGVGCICLNVYCIKAGEEPRLLFVSSSAFITATQLYMTRFLYLSAHTVYLCEKILWYKDDNDEQS